MRAIRAAALDLFAANGFAATRLDDVARGGGVAKGTIYLYFKSKEDLLEAIVRPHDRPASGEFRTDRRRLARARPAALLR